MNLILRNKPNCWLVFVDQQPDTITWRWEKCGIYTSKSVYKILKGGGREKWKFLTTWSSKIPPTVKKFAYHLLNGKLLTRDVLRRRGMNFDLKCVLCNSCGVESILHLFFLCPYATTFWLEISKILKRKLTQKGYNYTWGVGDILEYGQNTRWHETFRMDGKSALWSLIGACGNIETE